MNLSRNSFLATLATLTVVALTTNTAQAQLPAPSTLSGLNPGDTYQFIFVTSGTTAATTAGATFYNTFVQTAANTAGIGTSLSMTWKAMVATGIQSSPVRADVNAPVTATTKVYLINGTMVANGGTNPFYSNTNHLAAINITELGGTLSTQVWTGSNASGSESGSGLVGNGVNANPVWGLSGGTVATNSSGSSWSREGNATWTQTKSLYGISNALVYTVSSAPEPGTLAFLALGGMLVLARRRRK
ncbi:PEP-CTERM sorting domain-containing protein [Armatimonas sp.]|uniref:PEP-CTERM sorting domain-containing protein n=1 Tax=Armatimonas sp. TaxID=1872638 RepID=UPI00374CCC38